MLSQYIEVTAVAEAQQCNMSHDNRPVVLIPPRKKETFFRRHVELCKIGEDLEPCHTFLRILGWPKLHSLARHILEFLQRSQCEVVVDMLAAAMVPAAKSFGRVETRA